MSDAPEMTRAVQLEEIAFLQAQISAVRTLLSKRTKKEDPIGHFQFTQREKALVIELSELHMKLIPAKEDVVEPNGTLTAFRQSGKYYAEGRGYFPRDCFAMQGHAIIRELILTHNSGKCPGLSGPGADFIWVVRIDDAVPYGCPLLLKPAVND